MTSRKGVEKVVLLFGHGTSQAPSAALVSESSHLEELLSKRENSLEVSVVSAGVTRSIAGTVEHIRLDSILRTGLDRVFAALGMYALKSRLDAFPLGRLLNSLGPFDQSRVFWRAVKRHPQALRLLEAADTVIAVDLAATKTAWLALHRRWVDRAFYDPRSASVGVDWHVPTGDATSPQSQRSD